MQPDENLAGETSDSSSNLVNHISEDMHELVTVRGYGPYKNQHDLVVLTSGGTFPLLFRAYPYYANWFHALDELIVENPNYWKQGKGKRFLLRLKRSLSIGFSRRSHFAGILNGFKATTTIPLDIEYIKLITHSKKPVQISRTAAKIGLVIYDFSLDMERNIRRGFNNSILYITSVTISKSLGLRESFSYFFPNLIPGLTALELENYETQTSFKSPHSIASVNQYNQISNAVITPQGVIAKEIAEAKIRTFDHGISDYWPSPLWRSQSISRYLTPNVVGSIHIKEASSYMSLSANWAHFVEDNLPAVLGLIRQDPSRTIYISGEISNIQREALKILFPQTIFAEMHNDYNYAFDDVFINVHSDSRNLMIQGFEVTQDMVDFENMKQIRQMAIAKTLDKSRTCTKIFISRNGGFRRLVNKRSIESIFRANGFQIISAESLGFMERIELFQSASIVAGETGAGLVNLYFCKSGTQVIELRHPKILQSKEHLAVIELAQHHYQIIPGKKVRFFNKMRFGVDSFKVNRSEVSNAIKMATEHARKNF